MKILITGAAGFLGSHLVEHLLREGHSVVGVDNLSGGSINNFKFLKSLGFKPISYWDTGATDWDTEIPPKDYFQWSFGRKKDDGQFFIFDCYDCCDLEAMKVAAEDCDIVYHCACLPHEGLSVFSPHLITKSVYNASIAVFSAAIASGVKRIIYMSSMSRYGYGPIPEETLIALRKLGMRGASPTFTEDMIPKPVDPYGIAKVAAEETLKCLSETHGIEYVIAVPHNIIGTRQNFTDPHRNVASIMMNRLKQGKDVIIYGDGTQTRCFSPIADDIDSLIRMANLSDKTIVGQVINIGPDERGAITINSLAEKLYRNAGKVFSPVYQPDRPREVKHAACSSYKARKMLGYKEIQTLDDCLLQMWEQIPEGGKPFVYEGKPLEIVNEKTPKTWVEKLI